MDARVLWTLPKDDFTKINVHGFYPDEPLPNGNRSGIGIVFRNDKGTIVRMFGGSLGIQERRLNEFYAMLYALRKAFFLNHNLVELEFDHPGAYWEWRHSRVDGAIPEHLYVIRQLNTRRYDKNSIIDLNLVNAECNALATYLAQHGANTWDCMVEIDAPFGRVKELWYNDMGLGPIGPQYDSVHEANLNDVVVNAELEMLEGDEMV
ncbi:hypothetical protein POM88_021602 [Heracleum sosnowskyi]|uniref:RNase H type-1 domain-containing protein n=1 Tax=Heracleum sosnowskyi TaxID=360622 RepID=A0AAD8MSY3_9APIA|nr:hypothetical protein POM88_026435 [Heracleum sosnowskyi]KAK1383867.1 hypothetical protein POM88_021602 [Heracleum sosnowskyi]